MPRISVIIPFHDRIAWTCQAIDSVLCQTLQDFEILLIDDGSTDDISQLSSYLQNKKIIYIRQENKGVASARNRGLESASSEFIAFLDSDDLFSPDKLAHQLLFMQQNPLLLLSHTSYNRVDQTGHYIEQIHSGKFGGKVYPEIYTFCTIATPTVMIRRKVCVDNHLRFEEKISIAEDLLFWTEFAKRSDILGIDEQLTSVRVHDQSAFSDYQKQIAGYQNIITYGIEKDLLLPQKQKKTLLAGCYGMIFLLYYAEKDIENYKKYNQLSFSYSFFTWLKVLFKKNNRFFTLILLLQRLPGPFYEIFRSIWRKIHPKGEN
jgi:glycosyltransferase involved in cell wall biosynthesis